jgi:hypothetical protein
VENAARRGLEEEARRVAEEEAKRDAEEEAAIKHSFTIAAAALAPPLLLSVASMNMMVPSLGAEAGAAAGRRAGAGAGGSALVQAKGVLTPRSAAELWRQWQRLHKRSRRRGKSGVGELLRTRVPRARDRRGGSSKAKSAKTRAHK